MAGGIKGKARPASTGGDGGFGKDKAIGEDFGRYDRDPEAWLRGYVGGEVPGGTFRFGEQHDWDGDEGSFEYPEYENPEGFSDADCNRGYKKVK